jgi:hypothetical protein
MRLSRDFARELLDKNREKQGIFRLCTALERFHFSAPSADVPVPCPAFSAKEFVIVALSI